MKKSTFVVFSCLYFASLVCTRSQAYHFSTIASDTGGKAADGTNTTARFGLPWGIARNGSGNLFIADCLNHTIRMLRPISGKWVSSTLAGLTGYPGSADGTNADARFNSPAGIAVDTGGNLYVADSANHTIRKLTPSGTNWVVTTLAGWAGFPGSRDGNGSGARFFSPCGIAVDGSGLIYVADTLNHTIRKITPVGAYGSVTTLAGLAGNAGSADGTNDTVRFSHPTSITMGHNGVLYVADAGNYTIRQLVQSDSGWAVTTVAGTPGVSGSGDGSGDVAQFGDPEAVSADSSGNVYVADGLTNTVRLLTPNGNGWTVSTLAGLAGTSGSADGMGTAASFNHPQGLAAGNAGEVFVADTSNGTIRRVAGSGASYTATTIAGLAAASVGGVSYSQPSGVAVDSAGNAYIADAANQVIRKLRPVGPPGTRWEASIVGGKLAYNGSTDGLGSAARFAYPRGVAADQAGNLFVADTGNYTIRKLTPQGTNWNVTTIAGRPGGHGDADGTNSSARFYVPWTLTVDRAGNLYVLDGSAVRKVAPVGPDWVVTTIAGVTSGIGSGSADGTNSAARFASPQGIVLDDAGNLYVADVPNCAIRMVSPVGTNWVVRTIAGVAGGGGFADGTNRAARFYWPSGITRDAAGNLYVADGGNHAIRKMTRVGDDWVVTTVAGAIGVDGVSDGTGPEAQFGDTLSIGGDAAGNLYVADYRHNNVRFGEPVPTLWSAPTLAGLVLSWSGWATNYVVEAASNPASTNSWEPLPAAPAFDQGFWTVTHQPAAPNLFFRLRKQY